MRFRPLYLTKWPEHNEKNLNRLYFFFVCSFFFFFTHMEKLQLQGLNFTRYSWHLNSNYLHCVTLTVKCLAVELSLPLSI